MRLMKLYICHKADGAPCGNPAKIFGMKDGEKPTDEWEIYATVDFAMPSKFAYALIKQLNDYGDAYSDETLSETFENESAKLLIDSIRWILDTPDFVRVAYTARERISSDGEFAEWTRRVVLVKSP